MKYSKGPTHYAIVCLYDRLFATRSGSLSERPFLFLTEKDAKETFQNLKVYQNFSIRKWRIAKCDWNYQIIKENFMKWCKKIEKYAIVHSRHEIFAGPKGVSSSSPYFFSSEKEAQNALNGILKNQSLGFYSGDWEIQKFVRYAKVKQDA